MTEASVFFLAGTFLYNRQVTVLPLEENSSCCDPKLIFDCYLCCLCPETWQAAPVCPAVGSSMMNTGRNIVLLPVLTGLLRWVLWSPVLSLSVQASIICVTVLYFVFIVYHYAFIILLFFFVCLSRSILSCLLPPITTTKTLPMNQMVSPWCGTSSLRRTHQSTSFTVRYLVPVYYFNQTSLKNLKTIHPWWQYGRC